MAYERINWQNEPSEATALNDVNLNKMDSAIYDHDQRLDTAESDIEDIEGDVATAQGDITDLQNGKVDKVENYGLSLYKDFGYYQLPEGQRGTWIGYVGGTKQNGQLQRVGDVYNGVVVDTAMSSTSENPVQNKVVKSAIDSKSSVSVTPVVTEGTTLANITIDGTTTAIKGSDIEVDEELSPTSTNPVENKAIYDALNNLLPSKTVSGNPISISDASGFNAKALTVTMNPIQDLSHGDPSPTNVCPISGRDSVKVDRTGVNQWGGEKFADDIVAKVTGASKNTTNKTVTYTNTNIAGVVLLTGVFKENTQYSFFCSMNSGTRTNLRIRYTDDTTTTVSYSNLVTVTTVGKTVKQIEGMNSAGSTVLNYEECGLLEGVLTANDFEPYTAETHTHTYASTVYGGVDDFVSGEGSVTYAAVDLGTLNWTKSGSSANTFIASLSANPYKYTSTTICMSSHYKFIGYKTGSSGMATADNCTFAYFYTGTGTSREVYFKNTDYDDATAFKTAMSGVQLCYELATPTDISTTPEDISLLKGVNVLSTDGDSLELKYSVSLDSLLPATTRTLAKSPIVEEPKEETDETEEQR